MRFFLILAWFIFLPVFVMANEIQFKKIEWIAHQHPEFLSLLTFKDDEKFTVFDETGFLTLAVVTQLLHKDTDLLPCSMWMGPAPAAASEFFSSPIFVPGADASKLLPETGIAQDESQIDQVNPELEFAENAYLVVNQILSHLLEKLHWLRTKEEDNEELSKKYSSTTEDIKMIQMSFGFKSENDKKINAKEVKMLEELVSRNQDLFLYPISRLGTERMGMEMSQISFRNIQPVDILSGLEYSIREGRRPFTRAQVSMLNPKASKDFSNAFKLSQNYFGNQVQKKGPEHYFILAALQGIHQAFPLFKNFSFENTVIESVPNGRKDFSSPFEIVPTFTDPLGGARKSWRIRIQPEKFNSMTGKFVFQYSIQKGNTPENPRIDWGLILSQILN